MRDALKSGRAVRDALMALSQREVGPVRLPDAEAGKRRVERNRAHRRRERESTASQADGRGNRRNLRGVSIRAIRVNSAKVDDDPAALFKLYSTLIRETRRFRKRLSIRSLRQSCSASY